MSEKLSRRRIARHVVDRYGQSSDLTKVMSEVAAYLIESKRLREVDLVVRAIEDELALRGTVIARVTTAYPLEEDLRTQIRALIGGTRVYLDEHVDPSLIGGAKIETPQATLDTTIQRKLLALRQAKI